MKILLADDDPVTRLMLQAAMKKWGYEVIVCVNGAQAWEELQTEDCPKLAIIDWMMPEMDGPAICCELRKQCDRPYTYIILVTSRDKREDLIKGLDAGADDYITKPIDRTELRLRLQIGERIVRLQDELISARDAFEYQAEHDSLTGLWNRRAVLHLLDLEFNRARSDGTALSVIIGDLDNFKNVNDTYGHLAGDTALSQTAQRIATTVREQDSIGRYGGEEFIIVLPNCEIEEACDIAEYLRKVIAGKPVKTQEGDIRVTISLGVTQADTQRDSGVDSVMRAADAAMYRAKELGRNRVATSSGVYDSGNARR